MASASVLAPAELGLGRSRPQYYCHTCSRRVNTLEVDNGERECCACGDTFVERVDNADDLESFLGEEPVPAPALATRADVSTSTPAEPRAATTVSTSGAEAGGAGTAGLDSLLLLTTLIERLEQRGIAGGIGAGSGSSSSGSAAAAMGGLGSDDLLGEEDAVAATSGDLGLGSSLSASIARVLLNSALSGARPSSSEVGDRVGDYYFGDMQSMLHELFLRDSASSTAPATNEAVEKLRSVSLTVSEDEAADCAAAAARAEAESESWSPSKKMPAEGFTADDAASPRPSEDDYICSVCMDTYEAGQKTVRLKCGHKYHVDCVCQWLNTSNTCPVCRTPVD